MNKKLHILLVLLLLTGTIKVSAQMPAGYNQMMANNSMRFAQQMSMQRMMNQPWYFGSDYLQNSKYTFKVTLKDNSQLDVKSKIYADTATHKSYLIYVNKALKRDDPNRETKIYPEQTLKISRQEVNFRGSYDVNGMPTDSCWLFKVVTGKINMYSHLSETEMLNNMYLRAFQVGDGPVQKIDSASLVSLIKDSPKAMKAFNKKDYYKAIDKFNSEK
jgi:hypothetical protein